MTAVTVECRPVIGRVGVVGVGVSVGVADSGLVGEWRLGSARPVWTALERFSRSAGRRSAAHAVRVEVARDVADRPGFAA